VNQWLVGATMPTGCSETAGGIWTCALTNSDGFAAALVVWSATGSQSYAPHAAYSQYTDLNGATTPFSGGTVTISAKPIVFQGSGVDTTPPTAPQNLTASNVAATSTKLSWTSSTDNVGVVGYRLHVALDSRFTNELAAYRGQEVGLVTSTSVTGLSPNTSYYMRVRAYDAMNNRSDFSNTVHIVTLAH
jgi:hypothetical protein